MSYCILTANDLGTCIVIGAPDVSSDDIMDSWSVPCDVMPFRQLTIMMSAHLLSQVICVSPYSTHLHSPLGWWMTV
eukprot:2406057-Ditylum_brightwellii.AAC.1